MNNLLQNPRSSERAFSHEMNDTEIVDFESYRQLCDLVDDFRKIGIQEESSYEAIIQDERTVFTEYGGLRMPLLAPLEYEKMYNADRCRTLSGKDKAMLLAIPLSNLRRMELDGDYTIDEDTLVVVEEFIPANTTDRLDQHDVSGLPLANVKSIDFKNPTLAASPHNETAWMAAYGFHAQPKEGPSRMYEGSPISDDIMQKWHELCAEKGRPELPEESSTESFLLSAQQLAQRPDIIAQLWDISQIGFGEILGDHHPVSMEFNKEFFDKQIVADNTITSIHCVNGEVVCFGFVGLGMRKKQDEQSRINDEWLNGDSSVLKTVAAEADASQSAFVHVHELIGRGRRGMGYATKILNTFFEAASKTGYPYSVFFESTNLSSMYIPGLIARDLERSETMTMDSDIETLGKLSYWGLVAQPHSEEGVDSRLAA